METSAGQGEHGTGKSVKGSIRKIPSESVIRLWRNFYKDVLRKNSHCAYVRNLMFRFYKYYHANKNAVISSKILTSLTQKNTIYYGMSYL